MKIRNHITLTVQNEETEQVEKYLSSPYFLIHFIELVETYLSTSKNQRLRKI